VKGAGQAQSTCLMSPAYAYPTASSNPALLAYQPTAAPSLTPSRMPSEAAVSTATSCSGSKMTQITFDQTMPSSTPSTPGLVSTGQASQVLQKQTMTMLLFCFIMFMFLE
jgi:hypothetical protein